MYVKRENSIKYRFPISNILNWFKFIIILNIYTKKAYVLAQYFF